MFYSDETIEKVRDANDIVDVIGQYVVLEKSGNNYKGLCPFHREKTPSFIVTPDKQIYKCFGCQKGGNVFTFIMDYEKIDFVNAVAFLAEKARIELEESGSRHNKSAEIKKRIMAVNKAAARFYYSFLKRSSRAMEYIQKRGLLYETIKAYGIGAAPDEWSGLYEYLKSLDYTKDDCVAAKLIATSKRGEYIDLFRNRLIFPIIDPKGNVIAFGGRVFDDSIPKYINSPETAVYTKGDNLYGLNTAKHHCQDELILVEGYMDVVSLHQHGIRNAVAALGTALTDKQARLLSKYTKQVCLCYDSDSAGQKATMRAIEILSSIGIETKIAVIPGSKDPDEYIKSNNTDKFRYLLKNGLSAIEYRVQRCEAETDIESPEGKIKVLKEIARILSAVKSTVRGRYMPESMPNNIT